MEAEPIDRNQGFAFLYRDLLIFAALFLTVRWVISKRKDVPSEFSHVPLPPSPPGLPIFGNLLSLRIDMRPFLQKWTRELGGILNLRLGPSMNMIVISDLEIMQEAFIEKSHRFSERSPFPLVDLAFGREGMYKSCFVNNKQQFH